MNLKKYLFSMQVSEREQFAVRCGSTYGHLRNVAYGHKPCSAELAMEIERESGAAVCCEILCPGAEKKRLADSRLIGSVRAVI